MLIAEVEDRLQFNVFVSIFFCTLLYSFFRSLDKPDVDANKVLLHWAVVPALYFLGYVVFEYGRSVITDFWLKCTHAMLLIGSALFVLPMILMALSEAKWFRIEIVLGILSFWGIPIIALLLNLPIVIGIGAGRARRREAFRSGLAWCRTKMEAAMSQRTFSLIAGVVVIMGYLAYQAFGLARKSSSA